MSQEAKRVLGFLFFIFGLVIGLLILANLLELWERFGLWVPAGLIAVGIGIGFLVIRYPAFRQVLQRTTSFVLESISAFLSPTRTQRWKERQAVPPSLRRQVFSRARNKCERPGCNYQSWLHIHHIDEDPSHNVLDNLVALCPNDHELCHRGEWSQSIQRSWIKRRR